MGDKVQPLVKKAQTVEHYGFDCMASGHNPHCKVLLRRVINDLSNAEFFKHSRDQTQVIQDLHPVRLRLWRESRAVRPLIRLFLYGCYCIDTTNCVSVTAAEGHVAKTTIGRGI